VRCAGRQAAIARNRDPHPRLSSSDQPITNIGGALRRIAIALVGAAVAAGTGCAERATTIEFGAAGPWTEGYGQMNRRGIELAVDEINSGSLLDGRRLQVRYRDDGGDGSRAASIAEEFTADRRVVAVVGHVNSGAMVAAARVYDGRMPAVATTATSPDLSGISPWVFRVISSDSANGLDLARFARRLGRRRAAVLYENNSYGRGLTESFRHGFVGEIVSIDPIMADSTDFEPFITYYKHQRPDVVFVAGTERSGIAILREARRQRLDADFLGGDGWTGIVSDPAVAEGAYVGAPFSAEDPRPAARRFVATFRKKFGVLPDGNAALAYDATWLLAQAVAEAGPDRAEVRDYLASLHSRGGYAGATGSVRFGANGDPVDRGIVMTRVRRGTLLVQRGTR
jgi:branched-chain amino acid transport system substrate-binding protein